MYALAPSAWYTSIILLHNFDALDMQRTMMVLRSIGFVIFKLRKHDDNGLA
jgi:hypothetical protein